MTTITIVNVDVTTPAGKKYQMAEVVFKMNGETKTKKIMSFVNPSVFATIKDAKNGEEYTITQEKDQQGYWQWTSIKKGAGDGSATAATASTRTAASSTGRDFETKEERAERQRLIVRQSAVNYAVSMLTPGAKAPLDKDAVFALAEAIVAFVTDAPDLFEEPNDIPY